MIEYIDNDNNNGGIVKPITIKEVYSWTPISINKDLDEFYSIFNIEIVEDNVINKETNEIKLNAYNYESKHLEIRNYVNHYWQDGEYGYYLYSVWFKNKPFMLISSNTPEQTDEYITDRKVFLDAKNYFESIIPQRTIDEFDLETNVNTISCYKVTDYYDPNMEKPKYKVGDFVNCMLLKDSSAYSFDKTKIKKIVQIVGVREFNPTETYEIKISRSTRGTFNCYYDRVSYKDVISEASGCNT